MISPRGTSLLASQIFPPSNSQGRIRYISSDIPKILPLPSISSHSSSHMAVPKLEWLLPCPHSQSLQRTNLFSFPPPPRRFLIVCSVRPSSCSLLEEPSGGDIRIAPFRMEPSSPPSTSATYMGSSNGSSRELAGKPLTDALVFEYYQKARLRAGFRPDRSTLRILVRYLLKSKNWFSISALAEDFKAFSVFPEKSACMRLIDGCIKARKFHVAEVLLEVFETKQQGLATAAFASALSAYNKLHMYRSTVKLHDQMVRGGIPRDAGCYCSAMDAYRRLGNTDRALDLFHEVESLKLNSPPATFSRMCLILCDSLGRSARAFEALNFFREVTRKKGVSPDPPFYASLICAFTGIREAEIAGDLYQEVKEKGIVKDPSVFVKLVLMYVEVGLMGKTLEVVKDMRKMGFKVSDCVLSAVVNGHVKNGGLRAAVRAWEEIGEHECTPGQVTYASMINVYCRLGLTAKAEALFDEMLQRGYDKCVVAYGNIMSMYSKSSRIQDAMKLLARMKEKRCEPNVWVYNSLIDMHGRAANLRQVEKLWKEMERRKIVPDKISYTSIIGAYSKAREFEVCIRYYKEFREDGGRIDRTMAALMVGVFSKTSMFDELIRLLQDARSEGIQLDERLYMTSLNALRDGGLEIQVKWFKESFPYADGK